MKTRLTILVIAGGLVLAAGTVGVWLAADRGGESSATRPNVTEEDFSARFAGYEAAPEPNGDLSKVVWPDYVVAAGPEVKRLYEFQITHGELMRYMPCFCGCGQNAGHRSNRDCYVRRVDPDGSVVFDSMAPTWGICMGVTRDVMQMLKQGLSPREMRAAVDAKYAEQIGSATPTPYPPA